MKNTRRISVLIVDDEEDLREALGICFRNIGFRVDLSRDGLEAIEKFTAGEFDLVITDINMPRMDGRMVAQYIRASNKKLPIIVGMSVGTPDEEGLFDMFLQKPFSFTRLVTSIHKLIVEREAIA